MHRVSDIATDPKLSWIQKTGPLVAAYTNRGRLVRFVVFGERNGVRVKVVLEPGGEGIITGHPVP